MLFFLFRSRRAGSHSPVCPCDADSFFLVAHKLLRFVLNGLSNANQIFGEQVFNLKNWRVIGEYVYDDEGGRHQAFVAPIRSTDVLGSTIMPHERIQIEHSLKYSQAETEKLWAAAGLTEMGRWTRDDEYGKSDIQRDQVSNPEKEFL